MSLPSTSTPPAPGQRSVAETRFVIGMRPATTPAWWLDPIRATLFIVLPIFCLAAYFNRFNFAYFNASEDFLTPRTFALALVSMAMLVLGIAVGRSLLRRRDVVTLIDIRRGEGVLVAIGWVTIAAYALLLGTLLTQLGLVLELFRGNAGAGSELRAVLGRIPGVTSFIQFGIVYLALLSTLFVLAGYRPRPRIWVMTGAIFVLILLRAVLASERLAMLEALAAIAVVPAAYWWRPSLWRAFAPAIGIAFVFAAFAAGEYFRSWQFYQQFYTSYLDFISQRFFGYFSTSINNGAGAYILYGQYNPTPEITSGWIIRFPGIAQVLGTNEAPSMLDNFLNTYATPEFNNPGGFYAAYLDYPFVIASVFMVGLGVVVGMVHRSFQNKALVGLLLFPAVFLGQTDFIRLIYIADVRALPVFLGVFLVRYLIRPVEVPRDRVRTVAAGERPAGRPAVASG